MSENESYERDEAGRLKTPQKKKKPLRVIHEHHIVKNGDENLGVSDAVVDEYEDVEKEELRQRLAERETQLGAIALKAFEEEKKALVDAVRKDLGDDKANEIAEKVSNPQQLEDIKGWLGVFVKEFNKSNDDEMEGGESLGKVHSDSIPLRQPSKSGFSKGRDVVNALYDAYEKELFKKESGRKYDAIRLGEIERKIDRLWKDMKIGFLKRGRKLFGEKEGVTHRSIWTCPKCGKHNIDVMTCSCGYKVPESDVEWATRTR